VTGCNGTVPAAVAGNNTLSLSGATIPADGSCTFSLNVTGTTSGVKNNSTSNVASTEGGFGNVATASILVAPLSTFQIGYASNLPAGDSYVNLTNGATDGAFLGSNGSNGDICANVYVFDPGQEMLACCSCLVTPDGLNSFSVKNDLINKQLTPAVPSSVVIKVVASHRTAATCQNAASNLPNETFSGGLRAWGTTLHQNSLGGYSVTESPFQTVDSMSFPEFNALSQMCGFVLAEGSGNFGFCNTACTNTGQSGAKK
jgi:hypothetical protein